MKTLVNRQDIKGRVRLEMQDFKFVKGRNAGRMLRLTVTLRVDLETTSVLGVSLVGCLIRRNPEGKLEFQPPITRAGNMYIATILVTPDYTKLILDKIANSKYANDIGTGLDYQTQPETLSDQPIEVI